MGLMRHYEEEQYTHQGNPRKKRERGRELICKNNGLKLPKSEERHGHDDSGTPIRINPKRITPNYIIKLSKVKDNERIL